MTYSSSFQNITSTSFFREWVAAVENQRVELVDNWNNRKSYTKLILGHDIENNVIKTVGRALSHKVYDRNYYSLDAIIYQEGDLTPDVKNGQTWFRQIQAAFEHENVFNENLYEEVSHLLIVNCELRVLVTYPSNKEDESRILEYLHRVINITKIAKDLSEKASFLLVLGYKEPFEWRGLVYHNDGWLSVVAPNT